MSDRVFKVLAPCIYMVGTKDRLSQIQSHHLTSVFTITLRCCGPKVQQWHHLIIQKRGRLPTVASESTMGQRVRRKHVTRSSCGMIRWGHCRTFWASLRRREANKGVATFARQPGWQYDAAATASADTVLASDCAICSCFDKDGDAALCDNTVTGPGARRVLSESFDSKRHTRHGSRMTKVVALDEKPQALSMTFCLFCLEHAI